MTPHQTPPSDKLLPCPCCGGPAEAINSDVPTAREVTVRCAGPQPAGLRGCGIQVHGKRLRISHAQLVADLIARWNRRPTPPSVPTDEMVEAAARALYDAYPRTGQPPWERCGAGEKYMLLSQAKTALTAALAAMPGGVDAPERLDSFDAGELNTYGGGNVDWWLDYIRALLGDAEQFYQTQYAAILSRLNTSAIGAEGWRLVPIKPTPEMIKAGYEMLPTDSEWGKDESQAVDVWDEMLAAAPTPPTAQEG